MSPAGKPTHRQGHPKTSKSTRTVSVPSFTAEVLRERLVVVASEDPEHLIFFSPDHTPLLTNNVRRRLGKALAEAGSRASLRTPSVVRSPRSSTAPGALSWLPRCRAHIVGDHQAALREPDETVNPVTAEILEALAPRRRVELGDT